MTTTTTSTPNASDAVKADLPDVAFIGKAGAGKTTAAQWLVQAYGYMRLSFAGPLKDIAAQLWGQEARTDRDKLQRLGVAVREIHADTWVDLLLWSQQLRIKGQASPPRFVVDDCRFPNEYWRLKEAGFVFVRVDAPLEMRVDRLLANGKLQSIDQLDHESETALDTQAADYAVTNDVGQQWLHTLLRRVLNRERARVT